ncbi:glycosyltransferase family 4 protein [Patescibacteria group bacterium]|nr:glycosyltransferase family 4 protein [Patescibacteria group bacterium]MBU1674026.1 glycosyltransferase family 4 protein [Patescibacteria group bacterium]MBU1963832.1 glycosyltransferase family 4 protein [Patescibacteria group bacterium]
MKIGLIAVNYFPDLVGGAEFYTYNMMNQLAGKGHEIHVFTQLTAKGNRSEHQEGQVNVHRIKTYGMFYRLKYWPKLEHELRKHKLDRLIILDYAQNFTWKGLKYAKNNDIPVYLMINDIQGLKTGRNRIKHYFMEKYDQFAANRVFQGVDKIMVRTDLTKDFILDNFPVEPVKVLITPSGITEQEFEPGDPEAFKKKYHVSGNIILFLGRIRKQKGVFDLLEAFKKVKQQVPDAKLVYAGPDEKEHDGLEFTPQLKKIVREEGIDDVYFIGPVYGHDKNNALAACTVMAMPSSFENFGQAYSQALAQGKPVIGTYGGGIPEIIDENKDGFMIKTGDIHKLSDYLTVLLKDPEKARQMGESGHEKVRKYSYHQLADQFGTIIKG